MLLCFTDLDGTLLNHDNYQYEAAIPALNTLKAMGVPVIFNTSKTRAEVLELRSALGLRDPFVVENGSGIFVAIDDVRFDLPGDEIENGLKKVSLGFSYAEAQQMLQRLSQDFQRPIKGFSNMSEAELVTMTQLSPEALKLACDREFSEPFIRPEEISVEQLEAWAQANQIQILVGNRFCHILGAHAGKGNAVRTLTQAFQGQEDITTVGLGDSPNDLAMLEAVDIPIVIPGKNGAHPIFADRGWKVANAIGCQGWALGVEQLISLIHKAAKQF